MGQQGKEGIISDIDGKSDEAGPYDTQGNPLPLLSPRVIGIVMQTP